MPKINVYLPDDLAASVRAAGFPVSPVCQEALATAVRKVNRARKAIGAIRDPGFDPGQHPALGSSLHSRMTPRLGEVFRLARQASGDPAGTGQLLLGVLEEGHNLGLRLLQAVDIDPDELAAVLRQADLTEPGALDGLIADSGPGPDLTRPAWQALATALETAIELGHNYLGCEHLVLGLAAETDGTAGRVLRDLGADPAAARKALTSILVGYVHGRQADTPAGAEVLGDIARRLDALEALATALETAIELGHNYLGCEHLVLGLAAETDGTAGRVLRDLGADPAAARKALTSILAGYVRGRQADTPAGAEVLGDIARRLDALEARVATLGGRVSG